jgi:hypothetical protein
MARDSAGMLGEAVGEFVMDIFRGGVFLFRLGSERRARARAAQEALEDERASLNQQRKWREEVEHQMARGRAGFASEADARAALRGKGGRSSNLDRRKF